MKTIFLIVTLAVIFPCVVFADPAQVQKLLDKSYAHFEAYENPQAMQAALEAVKLAEAQLGLKHELTAEAYRNLANQYRITADFAQIKAWQLKALAVWEAMYGVDHPKTAGALNDLAMTLEVLKDYVGAEGYILRMIRIEEAMSPRDERDIAVCYKMLAEVLDLQGRKAEADLARAKYQSWKAGASRGE